MRRRVVFAALFAAMLVAAGGVVYRYPVRFGLFIGNVRNVLRSWSAPAGTTTTELNPAYQGAATPAPSPVAAAANSDDHEWPSYNRTLTSERYAPLAEINTSTVSKLKVLCTYDTKRYTAFEAGLIMVEGALIGTTNSDIFSLDPATCAENWRTQEDITVRLMSPIRGAAYLDGMLFRGSQDGRVLAYDFKTGKRIWQTTITENSEVSVGAAPIAWGGLVFIGNSSGDSKGGKGHMFALDAKTGKIVWEFFLVPRTDGDLVRGPVGASPLDTSTWNNAPGIPISGGGSWSLSTLDPTTGELYVPVGNPSPAYAIGVREGGNLYTGSVVVLDARTGAYKRHFKLVPRDWHDWDVVNPPSVIRTAGGKKLLAAAPKNGYLYGIDLDSNAVIYRSPVTKIENVDAPFSVDAEVRFCPGANGGSEWNGPAYDPQTNLVLVGGIEWCTSVKLQTEQQLRNVPTGGFWMGMATFNPFQILGIPDEDRGPGGSTP
jgi:alcohol dehydrogenase (cytochrome c)